jgi:hypothetical protein
MSDYYQYCRKECLIASQQKLNECNKPLWRLTRSLVTISMLALTVPLFSLLSLEQLVEAQVEGSFGSQFIPSDTDSAEVQGNESGIFKVDLFVFGVDNATEDVVTYVTAKNTTQAFAGNALEIDRLDNQSDGIGEVFYTFPEVAMNAGDKFEACAVKVGNQEIQCTTGFKGPTNRTEIAQILLNP